MKWTHPQREYSLQFNIWNSNSHSVGPENSEYFDLKLIFAETFELSKIVEAEFQKENFPI